MRQHIRFFLSLKFVIQTINICFVAGEVETPSWSCWSEWSTCTVTCGGPGKRSRERICRAGTADIGSQDVACTGTGIELDESCGSLDCPDPHCPDGYQYSSK